MRGENRRLSDNFGAKLLSYWPVFLSLATIIIFSFRQTVAIAASVDEISKLKIEHETVVMPSLQRYETHLAIIDERTLEILRRLDKIEKQTRR